MYDSTSKNKNFYVQAKLWTPNSHEDRYSKMLSEST